MVNSVRARTKTFLPLLHCQLLTLGLSRRLYLLNKPNVKLFTFSKEKVNANGLAFLRKKHN